MASAPPLLQAIFGSGDESGGLEIYFRNLLESLRLHFKVDSASVWMAESDRLLPFAIAGGADWNRQAPDPQRATLCEFPKEARILNGEEAPGWLPHNELQSLGLSPVGAYPIWREAQPAGLIALCRAGGDPTEPLSAPEDFLAWGQPVRLAVAQRLEIEGLNEFRTLATHIPDIVMTVDRQGTILQINQTVPGLSRAEAVGKTLFDFSQPQHHEGARAALESVFSTGQPAIRKTEGLGPNGSVSVHMTRYTPVLREGRVAAVNIIETDLTREGGIESALREREEWFQTLAETTSAAIIIFQGERLAYLNPAAEHLSGYNHAELAEKSFWAIIHPDDQPIVKERGLARQRGEEVPDQYEVRIRRKDGETVWGLIKAAMTHFESRPAVMITVFDITEKKMSEIALQESESKWRRLAENIPDFITSVDREGGILSINRTVPGIEKDSVVGRNYLDFVSQEYHDLSSKTLREVFRTGQPDSYRTQAVGPKGSVSWYDTRLAPVVVDGKVESVSLISTDITQQIETTEGLRKSEERFRSVINSSPVIFFAIDRDGVFTQSEGKGLEALGLKPNEVVGQSVFDLYGEFPEIIEANRRALAGESMLSSAEVGENVYETWHSPIWDDAGRVIGATGVSLDVSERAKAQQALRESEEKHRKLVEQSTSGILIHQDGHIVYLNQAAVEIIGGESTEPFLGKPYAPYFHPDEMPRVREISARVAETQTAELIDEMRLIKLDGSIIAVEMIGIPTFFNGRPAGQVIFSDITQRREAERNLAMSEARFRAITENTSDLTAIISQERTYRYVSPAVRSVFGVEPETLIGRPVGANLSRDDAEAIFRTGGEALKTPGVAVPLGTFRVNGLDNRAVYLEGGVTAMLDIPGVEGFVINCRDVTGRKEAEDALGRLGRFLDESLNEFYIADAETMRFIHLNRGALENLGYSMEEMRRKTPADITAGGSPEELKKRIAPLRSGEVPIIRFRSDHQRKDGSVYPVEIFIQPSESEGRRVFMAHAIDISERMKSEEALRSYQELLERKSKEMEFTLEQVAHDVRSPLFAITGYLQMFDRKLGESMGGDREKYLKPINEALGHLRSMIDDLQEVSRAGEVEFKIQPVLIQDVLDRVLAELKHRIDEKGVQLDIQAEGCWARFDPRRLRQILTNLLVNAIKFSSDQETPRIAVRVQPGSANVVIQVSDNGIGIAPEDHHAIFHPFHRIRTVSVEGSGVGLAVVQRLAERGGGRIWVESELGKGADFFLEIPKSDQSDSIDTAML